MHALQRCGSHAVFPGLGGPEAVAQDVLAVRQLVQEEVSSALLRYVCFFDNPKSNPAPP